MNIRSLSALAVIGIATSFSSIHAAAPMSCCPTVAATPSMSPAKFADTVATVDILEIKLGQVAQTNASLPSVKKFGAYMVKSHTALNKELTKLAASQKIVIPTSLDAKHQAIFVKLSALQGAAFDKTYIPAMVTGHTKVLAMFNAFAASTTDPAFKKYATKNAKVIATHLKAAQKVQAEMKAAGLL